MHLTLYILKCDSPVHNTLTSITRVICFSKNLCDFFNTSLRCKPHLVNGAEKSYQVSKTQIGNAPKTLQFSACAMNFANMIIVNVQEQLKEWNITYLSISGGCI